MFVRCFRGLFGFSTERSKGDVKSANGEHLKSERERERSIKQPACPGYPKCRSFHFFVLKQKSVLLITSRKSHVRRNRIPCVY